jgi:glycogen debranching enzyme
MPPDQAIAVNSKAEQNVTPFYISTEEASSRQRLSLKSGDAFIVLDRHGDIGATRGGNDGLYYNDTRFFSHLELLMNGTAPLLLGSNLRDDNAMLTVDLTNPDFYEGNRLILEKDILHIVRNIFLRGGIAYQRLLLRNYSNHPVDFNLALLFKSDFTDLFEVRGITRLRHGTIERTNDSDRVTSILYGLDNIVRRARLIFDPAPAKIEEARAYYRIKLAPQERKLILLSLICERDNEHKIPQPFIQAMRAERRQHYGASHNATTIETSNSIFNQVLCRSMADLRMLITETAQGPYPYAGIPWYSTTFGRDGLITALQMLWLDPSIARGTLRRLAAYQATIDDPAADAQPGKILHEMRKGEMAATKEIPFGLYYGSIDSTPLFVLLAGLYTERTGDLETLKELWPAIEAALNWINGPADPDRDGFIEYKRANENGLVNQGWKDSHDAIFHSNGEIAKGPIALAEVQGYVYAAKLVAARCARLLEKPEQARKWKAEALRLAKNFERAFWLPELNTYAIALDGEKKPCRVRTSNAGQVLFSGIASLECARAVAYDLMQPRFFSGWGVRTLASDQPRYNPMSYHNGSVWPHDNALIALGLARYNLKSPIERIFKGLFTAATYMELRRLPELFCGFQRARARGPTLYPVACSPQAWAAATPFTLIEACLGLEFDPGIGEIRLRNPRLPAFIEELTLHNLRLNDASIDLRVRRHGEEVSMQILGTRGKIQVSVVFGRE